ncbi:unnamed protein product, partial [Prunus brigantina]
PTKPDLITPRFRPPKPLVSSPKDLIATTTQYHVEISTIPPVNSSNPGRAQQKNPVTLPALALPRFFFSGRTKSCPVTFGPHSNKSRPHPSNLAWLRTSSRLGRILFNSSVPNHVSLSIFPSPIRLQICATQIATASKFQ